MTREEIISRSFREYPKTINQISRETGIPSGEICRVVSKMEEAGTIWKLYRRFWPLSDFMAYVWTTNVNITWGYRASQALFGKGYGAEEQIAMLKTIKCDIENGK